MIAQVEEMSGYGEKRAAYGVAGPGRYRRGIGMSLWFHGRALPAAASGFHQGGHAAA
jgi:hypothetical protein